LVYDIRSSQRITSFPVHHLRYVSLKCTGLFSNQIEKAILGNKLNKVILLNPCILYTRIHSVCQPICRSFSVSKTNNETMYEIVFVSGRKTREIC